MSEPLAGMDAVVTGAGSGIGLAIAAAFVHAGARVAAIDSDRGAGERAVAAIQRAPGTARLGALDITDEAALSAFAGELASAGWRIGALVNNAGIGHVGSFLGTDGAALDRLLAINVRGTFNVSKAFVPAMIQRAGGSVINIASVAGVVAVRDRFAYTTSKFAVVGMTKSMALDHSATGVRFNAICPGRVDTPFVQRRLAEYPDPAAAYREMAATQLAGRLIKPEEVAAAAVYLASDIAAMVTGSCLMIDSGWSAGK